MDHWHGFGTNLNISQIYETTIADHNSNLSSHFVVVPARSLGGGSYLFRDPQGLLETLGLVPLADIPAGRVVHSLAACLVSEDVEDFTRRFHGLFEEEGRHGSMELPAHFAFAEYLTFARVVPFESSSPLSADSLGNILTAQGRGEAGYMYYEGTEAPVLFVAIPAGMLICGSSHKVIEALEAGLRRRILEFAKMYSSGRMGRRPKALTVYPRRTHRSKTRSQTPLRRSDACREDGRRVGERHRFGAACRARGLHGTRVALSARVSAGAERGIARVEELGGLKLLDDRVRWMEELLVGSIAASHYREGRPEKEVVRLGKELDAGLILSGGRWRPWFERIFGAGFSENLSRRADRPVLAVSELGLRRSTAPR